MKISLTEFHKDLNSHDWNYQYSDDHDVWARGNRERVRLQRICDESPEHRQLYLAFINQRAAGNLSPALSDCV